MLRNPFLKKNEKVSPSSFVERRRLERIRMLLTIICNKSSCDEPFRIMTENINVLGIKFVSTVQLFPGEIVSMNILLCSYYSNINCKGRVVWCDKKVFGGKLFYEGGIEFVDLSLPDKNYLQKYIDKFKVDEFLEE